MEPAEYDAMFNSELDHWWYRSLRSEVGFRIDRFIKNDTESGAKRVLDIGGGTRRNILAFCGIEIPGLPEKLIHRIDMGEYIRKQSECEQLLSNFFSLKKFQTHRSIYCRDCLWFLKNKWEFNKSDYSIPRTF